MYVFTLVALYLLDLFHLFESSKRDPKPRLRSRNTRRLRLGSKNLERLPLGNMNPLRLLSHPALKSLPVPLLGLR